MKLYYPLLIFLSGVLTNRGNGTAENAKKFVELCSALRAARATVTDAVYLGDDSNNKVPEVVRALYATTLDTSDYQNKTFGVFADEANFNSLKEHIATAKDEHKRLLCKVAADCPPKHMVNLNFYQIYNDTNAIVEELKRKTTETKALTKDAKDNMAKAITGTKYRKTSTKDDFDTRANACTESAAGAAGKKPSRQPDLHMQRNIAKRRLLRQKPNRHKLRRRDNSQKQRRANSIHNHCSKMSVFLAKHRGDARNAPDGYNPVRV
uniref:Variant surface glycoprotein 1125.1595 n=1 Tax=Trypanosoma brucei TaxID=5691 RepID=A0A1J0R7B4_9TRYP|nr:variant surface glycoprotein 1125.1595 [Trypanosoma brucei]